MKQLIRPDKRRFLITKLPKSPKLIKPRQSFHSLIIGAKFKKLNYPIMLIHKLRRLKTLGKIFKLPPPTTSTETLRPPSRFDVPTRPYLKLQDLINKEINSSRDRSLAPRGATSIFCFSPRHPDPASSSAPWQDGFGHKKVRRRKGRNLNEKSLFTANVSPLRAP